MKRPIQTVNVWLLNIIKHCLVTKHDDAEVSGETVKTYFTITAEILARSLANFYCQYADRHMNLKIRSCQCARPGNSTICYRKKQIDVSF